MLASMSITGPSLAASLPTSTSLLAVYAALLVMLLAVQFASTHAANIDTGGATLSNSVSISSTVAQPNNLSPTPTLDFLSKEQPTYKQQQVDQQQYQSESATDSQSAANRKQRPNNVDKLKRGLSNFMSHLNAAPYFVPPPLQHNVEQTNIALGKTPVGSGSFPPVTGELAAIVNPVDPSVDVLMKGPIRVAGTRPIGGPLRWGRRR